MSAIKLTVGNITIISNQQLILLFFNVAAMSRLRRYLECSCLYFDEALTTSPIPSLRVQSLME
jgi:hypothetical protein